jgi:hypothetical protein
MISARVVARAAALLAVGWLVPLSPGSALGHCDGMDGPVVTAARKALAENDVNLVLIWVRQQEEQEIRRAFDLTQDVRKRGAKSRELADRYFFETLVRVHRAGEGAPYAGLKPAGLDLGPAIPLADRALDDGDIEALADLVAGAVRRGLIERYDRAVAAHDHDAADVAAGRDFVDAYVAFIHFAERVYALATEPVSDHLDDHEVPAEHDD